MVWRSSNLFHSDVYSSSSCVRFSGKVNIFIDLSRSNGIHCSCLHVLLNESLRLYKVAENFMTLKPLNFTETAEDMQPQPLSLLEHLLFEV